MASIVGARVMSGTFGSVQWDGLPLLEVSACQAKVSFTKEKLNFVGQMAEDSKIVATSGTFSFTIKKVYSRFADYATAVEQGEEPRATVIIALDDPSAYGAERVALYSASLDELVLMDWKVASTKEITIPGTFVGFEMLDKIEP